MWFIISVQKGVFLRALGELVEKGENKTYLQVLGGWKTEPTNYLGNDHEPVVYSQNLLWHLSAAEAVRTETPVHPPDEYVKIPH